MARKERGFWQRLGKTITVLTVVAMAVALFAQQGLAREADQLVWQNTANQKTAYWVLNSNGTLKNRTQADGWDNIGTWQLATGWFIQAIHSNGGKDNANRLVWQNTLNGKSAYWVLNSNGSLKNRTQGNGWDNIGTWQMATAWRIYAVNATADQTNDHLEWFNTTNRKTAYWVLNSNGTLKNRTENDGWGLIGTWQLGSGWYTTKIQTNADKQGNKHILWHNTQNGKSAYWKLNSNGTLKNRTQADGWDNIGTWQMPTSWRMIDLQTNADKQDNTHIVWQNTGNRKTAYWKLNSNGTLKNRTQADGWDNIGTWQMNAGWAASRILANGDSLDNDHLLWLNTTNGKSAYWKLNSNGTLKNRTQADGWDNIGTWQMPTTWRIRGAHKPY